MPKSLGRNSRREELEVSARKEKKVTTWENPATDVTRRNFSKRHAKMLQFSYFAYWVANFLAKQLLFIRQIKFHVGLKMLRWLIFLKEDTMHAHAILK